MNGDKPLTFDSIYRGVVVDNNDPKQQCRCKIRVYPMFAEVDIAAIPWAVPEDGKFDGAGPGYGSVDIPEIGAKVWVKFENGDIYQPVYGGGAKDGVSGQLVDALDGYPNIKMWKTKSGITFYVNKNANITRIIHPSGQIIEINDATLSMAMIHPSGSRIDITNTNDVKLTHALGSTIKIGALGSIVVDSVSTVVIRGLTVNINPL